MIKNFTSEHLVSFLYHETSPSENVEIKAALKADADLQASYNDLKDGYSILPKAQFRPSANALRNILNYSKESTVVM